MQTPCKSSLNSTTHFLTAYLRPQWALAGLCHYATCYLALIDHFNHPVCLSDTRHARTHMRTHSQRRPCLTSSWVRQTQSINLVIRQLEQIGTCIAGMLIVLARPTRQRPAAVTHSKDPASHEVGLRLFFFSIWAFRISLNALRVGRTVDGMINSMYINTHICMYIYLEGLNTVTHLYLEGIVCKQRHQHLVTVSKCFTFHIRMIKTTAETMRTKGKD